MEVELASVDVDEDALSVAIDIGMEIDVDMIWYFVSWLVRDVIVVWIDVEEQGGRHQRREPLLAGPITSKAERAAWRGAEVESTR